MLAEMLLEAFAPVIAAYKRIEDCEAVLKETKNKSLRQAMERMQAQNITTFEQLLDREIDARVDELMALARRELVLVEEERQAQQARQTPQVLAPV